jgi:hypothetical protein
MPSRDVPGCTKLVEPKSMHGAPPQRNPSLVVMELEDCGESLVDGELGHGGRAADEGRCMWWRVCMLTSSWCSLPKELSQGRC